MVGAGVHSKDVGAASPKVSFDEWAKQEDMPWKPEEQAEPIVFDRWINGEGKKQLIAKTGKSAKKLFSDDI